MSRTGSARILSVVLLVMTSPASVVWGQEEPAKPLTLEEAVSLARSHNRELKQAGLEIHKQKEALSEAKTQFYPRFDTYLLASELLNPLDFTIPAGTFGTFPATGPIPAKESTIHTPARPVAITSVTATQPLTQLLRIDLSNKRRELLIGGSAIAAAGALAGAAFAAETTETFRISRGHKHKRRTFHDDHHDQRRHACHQCSVVSRINS
jgi:outer membrane protein TolC